MAVHSRRSFVAVAGMASLGALLPSVARASEGKSLLDLLGIDGPDSSVREAAAGGEPHASPDPAADVPPLPDYSGYSDDETAAIVVDALRKRDFETVLALCAIDDYLDSGIPAYTVLAQLAQDVDIDLENVGLRVAGTQRMLWSAYLRGLYACDILHGFATVAADLTGLELNRFPLREDPDGVKTRFDLYADNIGEQLVELDGALATLDATELEVMGIGKLQVVDMAVDYGWLAEAYRVFEQGRALAQSLHPELNLDLAVYRITLGRDGEEYLHFTLPLCRYGDTWRLQRPCAYDDGAEAPLQLVADEVDDHQTRVYQTVHLPDVDYRAASPVVATPYATHAEAVDALLAAFGLETERDVLDPDRPDDGRVLARVLCPDEYLRSLDLASAYQGSGEALAPIPSSPMAYGFIGFCLKRGCAFVPVRAEGYRTLAGYALAGWHGAYMPLYNSLRDTRYLLRDMGYSRGMVELLSMCSPLPFSGVWSDVRQTLTDLLSSPDGDGEAAYDQLVHEEFDPAVFHEWFLELSMYWNWYGAAALSYTAIDDMAKPRADSLANYFGGPVKACHSLCVLDDVWRPLRCMVSGCAGGWRVADVEFVSSMSSILPSLVDPQGLAALEGMSASEVERGLREGEGDLVEDLRAL